MTGRWYEFSGKRGGHYTLYVKEGSQYGALEVRLPGLDRGRAVFLVNVFAIRLIGVDQFLPVVAEVCEEGAVSRLSKPRRFALVRELCRAAIREMLKSDPGALGVETMHYSDSVYDCSRIELTACKPMRNLVEKLMHHDVKGAEEEVVRLAGLEQDLRCGVPDVMFLFEKGFNGGLQSAEVNGEDLGRTIYIALRWGKFVLTDHITPMGTPDHAKHWKSGWRKLGLTLLEDIASVSVFADPNNLSAYRHCLWFFVPIRVERSIGSVVPLLGWESESSVARMGELLYRLALSVDTSIHVGLPVAVYAQLVSKKKQQGEGDFLDMKMNMWQLQPIEDVGLDDARVLELRRESVDALWKDLAMTLDLRLRKSVYTTLSDNSPVALPPEDEPPRVFRVANIWLDEPLVVDEGPADAENIKRLVARWLDPYMVIVGYPVLVMPYYIDQKDGALRRLKSIRGVAHESCGRVVVTLGSTGDFKLKFENGMPVADGEICAQKEDVVFAPEVESLLKKAVRKVVSAWERTLLVMKRMVDFKS